MKKFFLIRHGQSEHNLKNIFGGRKIDEGLTANGRKDAHLITKKISDLNETISFIFHSPMQRSIETAKIIQVGLDKNFSKRIKLICIDELIEVNVGSFSGKTQEEVISLYPKAAKAFYDKNLENWDFPDGENYHQIVGRVKEIMKKVSRISQNFGPNIIVGHAILNRIIIDQYLSKEMAHSKKFHFKHNSIVEIKLKEAA